MIKQVDSLEGNFKINEASFQSLEMHSAIIVPSTYSSSQANKNV